MRSMYVHVCIPKLVKLRIAMYTISDRIFEEETLVDLCDLHNVAIYKSNSVIMLNYKNY